MKATIAYPRQTAHRITQRFAVVGSDGQTIRRAESLVGLLSAPKRAKRVRMGDGPATLPIR
jgi:hypothetical protein